MMWLQLCLRQTGHGRTHVTRYHLTHFCPLVAIKTKAATSETTHTQVRTSFQRVMCLVGGATR